MAKVASDFDKIIQEGRDRRRNELLAKRIFSKDRQQSEPPRTKTGTGPSLASRVGVKKRVASLGPKAAPLARGNVDGEWAHDLHAAVNPAAAPDSLAARITAPGARPTRRAARVANALMKLEAGGATAAQARSALAAPPAFAPTAPGLGGRGLSIRGLAGPFAVMAQNFAPGTTAADIESAMTPVGGEMASCVILKTAPIVVAEMVFSSREGGEQVIAAFNNQTADGRIIKVYPKPGGYQPSSQRQNAPPNAPNGPRGYRARDQVVDGSLGFAERPHQYEAHYPPEDADYPMESEGGRELYSDDLVQPNRRGRGFNRGRGSR